MQTFLENIEIILYFLSLGCPNSPASPDGWSPERSCELAQQTFRARRVTVPPI